MARKPKMPDDVRDMTAEMRKNYEEHKDGRPRLVARPDYVLDTSKGATIGTPGKKIPDSPITTAVLEVPEHIRKGGNSSGTLARQASKGGNAPGESKSSGIPSGHNPALDGYSGPRIVINPSTFSNKKDALCVGWNEALRVAMEAMDYQPTSEPTEAQRRFFADTPYADDELQLRRTILARICVFDTSIS